MFDLLKRLFGAKLPDAKVTNTPSPEEVRTEPAPLLRSRIADRTSSVLSCPHTADYVILDTETTGLSPYADRVIQISAIRYDREGTPTGFFDTILNPCCFISPQITAINGITNLMVADAPCADQVQDAFLSFLGDALLVGYNVAFDLRFLNQTFPGFFPGRRYVDVLPLTRHALDLPSYKLESVASGIGFQSNDAFHDSFIDCEAVAAILRRIGADLDFRAVEFNSHSARPQASPAPPSPEPGFVFWQQGEALRRDGQFTAAIQLYDRARGAGWIHHQLYESYAMAYRREGNFEAEVSILEEALRHYPKPPFRDIFLERKRKAQERLDAHKRKKEALRLKEEERARKAEERRLKQELEAARPKQTSHRTVLQCTEDGTVLRVFPSLSDASKEVGVSTKCIRECANGRQKHAGGYCWKFPDTSETNSAQIP